jgi:class 3 adenylate cyclase
MPTNEPQLHERLRALLPSARAESCQIIATFLDIRGFSTFSAAGESVDIALYLRAAYSAILRDYFSDAVFFKPTGDGLLVVHELSDDTEQVKALVNSILERSLTLVKGFGTITSTDVLINFEVPSELGIGIARGTVTKLVAGGFVLDYTGRCLNLAARLMDKARPCGVVFADSHALNLMSQESATRFHQDRICIRGIADTDPMAVFVSSDVRIARGDREPLPESRFTWGDASELSVAEVRETSGYSFWLPRTPRSFEEVGVHFEYPSLDKNGKDTGTVHSIDLEGELDERPSGPVVTVSFDSVKRALQAVAETTLTFWGNKKTRVKFTPFICVVDDN